MMSTKVSDMVSVGEIWRSEWEVDWRVVGVGDTWADVKMLGGRSIHRVFARELQDWTRVEEES